MTRIELDKSETAKLLEEIGSLQQQNRMLRRSMWHHVRLGGGVTVIKHNDFINYYEVDEVLHWHYDEGLHATVYKSVDSAGRLVSGEFRARQFTSSGHVVTHWYDMKLLWADIKGIWLAAGDILKETWAVWRGK